MSSGNLESVQRDAMSAQSHSRRFLDIQLTSASPSIAVIGVRRSERRDGPCMDGARGARGI